MIQGFLLLLTGLTISAVAIYYSVLGLAAIFAAATVPIYIMGGTLEIAKLVAASWLKANWYRVSGFIKWYMMLAVSILMLITSMGIFGFLSKAHSDQTLVGGGNQVQITELDRQIAIEKRSIEDATKVIAQLDQAVQSLTNAQRIRGSDGAIAVRRSQSQERNSLNDIIKKSNIKISELEQQKIPLVRERLAIEAEVGPIKYIAAFVYGSDANTDILEKAVTWVIILLVIVFDPLAIAMILAAQMTFGWYKNSPQDTIHSAQPNKVDEKKIYESHESNQTVDYDQFDLSKHPYLFNKTEYFKNPKPMVAKIDPEFNDNDTELEENTKESQDQKKRFMIKKSGSQMVIEKQ